MHHPHGVQAVRYEARKVEPDQIDGIIAFFMLFFLTFTVLAVTLTFMGQDLETAASGALTALTNVGPGLGDQIGPSGNFANVPDSAKWLLSLAMLLGRLEILAVLVIFTPAFWSR